MKVLVTGGAGFIGFSVASELNSLGHDVIILDKEKSGRNKLNWLLAGEEKIKRLHANVNHLSIYDGELKDVEAVIHCAAQTAVTKSLQDPEHDFIMNVEGTLNVCEFARRHDAKLFYTSTNKVYGENVNKFTLYETETGYERAGLMRIDENFPIDQTPHTPYGVSKLAADLYVQEYHHIYGLETVVFRMSCIYGSQQQGTEDQGWISHMVKSWVYGKDINIFGNGKQVRDILYIDDLIKLVVLALDNTKSGVYNVGGGIKNTISIFELLDLLNKWEPKITTIDFHPWRQADQKVYISDISKVQKTFNWSPTISPKEGIKRLFVREMTIKNSVSVA